MNIINITMMFRIFNNCFNLRDAMFCPISVAKFKPSSLMPKTNLNYSFLSCNRELKKF